MYEVRNTEQCYVEEGEKKKKKLLPTIFPLLSPYFAFVCFFLLFR